MKKLTWLAAILLSASLASATATAETISYTDAKTGKVKQTTAKLDLQVLPDIPARTPMNINLQLGASFGIDPTLSDKYAPEAWADVWVGACIEIVPSACLGLRVHHRSNVELADEHYGQNTIDLYLNISKTIGSW